MLRYVKSCPRSFDILVLCTKPKAVSLSLSLLIVIVVIAVLAAISVVAYSGIQNRANDSDVQNDLKNIAKQFELYKVDHGVYPVGDTQLATVSPKVSKSAYGNGVVNGTYNILYCRVTADGPDKFALVASSKSGNVFTYKSETGQMTQSAAWANQNSSAIIYQDAGINQVGGSDRDWFYLQGSWRPYTN